LGRSVNLALRRPIRWIFAPRRTTTPLHSARLTAGATPAVATLPASPILPAPDPQPPSPPPPSPPIFFPQSPSLEQIEGLHFHRSRHVWRQSMRVQSTSSLPPRACRWRAASGCIRAPCRRGVCGHQSDGAPVHLGHGVADDGAVGAHQPEPRCAARAVSCGAADASRCARHGALVPQPAAHHKWSDASRGRYRGASRIGVGGWAATSVSCAVSSPYMLGKLSMRSSCGRSPLQHGCVVIPGGASISGGHPAPTRMLCSTG
jgi:hypothetical protein